MEVFGVIVRLSIVLIAFLVICFIAVVSVCFMCLGLVKVLEWIARRKGAR